MVIQHTAYVAIFKASTIGDVQNSPLELGIEEPPRLFNFAQTVPVKVWM